MHTKRGAIFWSPLGRQNVVSDFGVHIILYARFCHSHAHVTECHLLYSNLSLRLFISGQSEVRQV